jgi:hypothetical protein
MGRKNDKMARPVPYQAPVRVLDVDHIVPRPDIYLDETKPDPLILQQPMMLLSWSWKEWTLQCQPAVVERC